MKGYSGSVANPTWTFSADAATGWYQSATGKLTASISGAKGIEQDSTGFSDGAAATIASATTTNLASTPSGNITISGTTTITGFGTAADGVKKAVTFSGALTLTHNGTSLILPGAANITTAAGDTALVQSLGSGNWRVANYNKATGFPVAMPIKAWVHFTGSTATVNKSLNVSSVTRNAAGDYTINFTSALADTNYAVIGSIGDVASNSGIYSVMVTSATSRTTSLVRIVTTNSSGVPGDFSNVMIMVLN